MSFYRKICRSRFRLLRTGWSLRLRVESVLNIGFRLPTSSSIFARASAPDRYCICLVISFNFLHDQVRQNSGQALERMTVRLRPFAGAGSDL
jgi:hypothetical protein